MTLISNCIAQRAVLLSLFAALTGCATTYTNVSNPLTGFAGGYYDEAGPGKLITVGFAANGYTDTETVRRYVLRRACEVVQAAGKSEFFVFTSLEDAAARRMVGEDLGIPSLGGKPFSRIYVLPLAGPQVGSMNAAEVLDRTLVKSAKEEG
ncbi:MAG: hypothetical protein K0M64_07270 [Rhizobium sp.]|nr:hypothetical protein [Rhizobium sp.]